MVAPRVAALSRRASWLVAVVATLAMTVSYIDRQALAQLAPTVREALHIDHAQYGMLTAAFGLSYLVGAPLAGWLLDRMGARRGLAISVVVWSGVSALHALAPSFAVLLALRLALGAAESPSFPGATRTVRQALRPGDRSAGVGLVFTGSSFGAMIAAPLAIGLKVSFGWQLAFVGTSLCGLLWVPLWLFATGGSRKAALAADRSASAPPPVPWGLIFRNRAVHRQVLFIFLVAPLSLFVFNWAPQLLVEHFHAPQDELARYLWFPPLLFDAGAVGFGWLAAFRDRRSDRPRSHVAYVMLAAALGSTICAVTLAPSAMWGAVLAAVAMLGAGGLFTLATADSLARNPVEASARVGALGASAQSLAQIVLMPLMGVVLDRTHSYGLVLAGVAALLLPAALLWSLWPMPGGRGS